MTILLIVSALCVELFQWKIIKRNSLFCNYAFMQFGLFLILGSIVSL